MARAHRLGLFGLVATIIYGLVFLQFMSFPYIEDDILKQLVPVVPWWLLVSFGSYSLWSLGWGLWTFRDCPEAYKELMTEITQAKLDLRAKGIIVN